MESVLPPADWWNNLEPQWQQTFSMVVLSHQREPTEEELGELLNLTTIRLAGPSAPFPNCAFELTNLSGLQQLRKLTIVVVTHHKIESIEVIGLLQGLQSLFLLNNSIASLTGIENLLKLEQLYVQHNQIGSIKPVEKLLNLKEFYIHDNCITSLDGLTENHSDKLTNFICRPNSLLKQKEIIRAERDLGIMCR